MGQGPDAIFRVFLMYICSLKNVQDFELAHNIKTNVSCKLLDSILDISFYYRTKIRQCIYN